LCSFLHSPVTSSFFGPNILLRTLFSNTLPPPPGGGILNVPQNSWRKARTCAPWRYCELSSKSQFLYTTRPVRPKLRTKP
jgi:hypothetical protein